MEEGEVGDEDIVEVDLGVGPGEVEMCHAEADVFVRHQTGVDELLVYVQTAGEASAKQIDAHDAEDEPEDETNHQDVEDGRDSLDQRVHHHLQQHQQQPLPTVCCTKITRYRPDGGETIRALANGSLTGHDVQMLQVRSPHTSCRISQLACRMLSRCHHTNDMPTSRLALQSTVQPPSECVRPR